MSKPKWNSAKKRKIKNELTQGIYKCVMCSNIFDSVDCLQIEHKTSPRDYRSSRMPSSA
ncbi:hypothetical protein JMUB7540_28400 [Staphylococcus aureus]